MNPFKLFIFLFLLSSCSSVSDEERMDRILELMSEINRKTKKSK